MGMPGNRPQRGQVPSLAPMSHNVRSWGGSLVQFRSQPPVPGVVLWVQFFDHGTTNTSPTLRFPLLSTVFRVCSGHFLFFFVFWSRLKFVCLEIWLLVSVTLYAMGDNPILVAVNIMTARQTLGDRYESQITNTYRSGVGWHCAPHHRWGTMDALRCILGTTP